MRKISILLYNKEFRFRKEIEINEECLKRYYRLVSLNIGDYIINIKFRGPENSSRICFKYNDEIPDKVFLDNGWEKQERKKARWY